MPIKVEILASLAGGIDESNLSPHSTEPANYTDSCTTVLAEEFPNSERRVAAAAIIVGFIICLFGYFVLEDMEIIIY
jgi:hypothetical protein